MIKIPIITEKTTAEGLITALIKACIKYNVPINPDHLYEASEEAYKVNAGTCNLLSTACNLSSTSYKDISYICYQVAYCAEEQYSKLSNTKYVYDDVTLLNIYELFLRLLFVGKTNDIPLYFLDASLKISANLNQMLREFRYEFGINILYSWNGLLKAVLSNAEYEKFEQIIKTTRSTALLYAAEYLKDEIKNAKTVPASSNTASKQRGVQKRKATRANRSK